MLIVWIPQQGTLNSEDNLAASNRLSTASTQKWRSGKPTPEGAGFIVSKTPMQSEGVQGFIAGLGPR